MIVIALWIIAICEIVRTFQNHKQLSMMHRDESARNNAYSEFVKSLKDTDKEFVQTVLDELNKATTEQHHDEVAIDSGCGWDWSAVPCQEKT